ncbi:MAG: tRNA (adenosine(37)-N6)-threonylcarbamoyltransferase complex dimerization subunit type 1 TsaB [Clostridiales bacterium]|jgi:tRNA threonylcarbamoyladenosine biosynthesis protein TsaB|nr:tRNA (adenosine(37)-N6)-threonylcarbamoyltransferase complex dimerization subunit type 1 TsaB [Clostridiales bacterium]
MRVLAIDTATSSAGAAVADEQGIIASFGLNVGKTHSQRFLPLLESLLNAAETPLQEMTALAVTVGPGSFTGLRIGLATVKAWGQALKLPLVPITTLEAIARANLTDGLVCPVFDARKNEAYCSLFRGSEQLWPNLALNLPQLAHALADYPEPIIFAGDAAGLYQDFFREALGERFVLAQEERRLFLAPAAAILGRERYLAGNITNAEEIKPLYLRQSEAEVKFGQKEINNEQ